MGYEDLKIPSYNVPSAYDNKIVIYQGYYEPRKRLPPPAYIPPVQPPEPPDPPVTAVDTNNGVYGYGLIHEETVFTEMLAFAKGWLLPFRWTELEPEPGVFVWDEFDEQIGILTEAGVKITLMAWTGNNAPEWLYGAPYNVPRVETDREVYPYYFNPATFTPSGTYHYLTRYNMMLDAVRNHVKDMEAYANGDILYQQIAEGTTGDIGPWHGEILNVTVGGATVNKDLYEIDEASDDWINFKQDLIWTPFWNNLRADTPDIGMLINTGNGGEHWEWVEENIPDAYVKSGNLSHRYSFIAEAHTVAYIQGISNDGRYTRGEFDDPPIGTAWWQGAPNKNTMAMMASCLHAGLAQWNINSNQYENNTSSNDAYDFFNEFAVKPIGYYFCFFRDMLDINDITRFPEGSYGTVIDPLKQAEWNAVLNGINSNPDTTQSEKNIIITNQMVKRLNQDRIDAIKADFPTAEYLPLDTSEDYYNNDFGCDMVSGNWHNGIIQYDQFNTCTPVWRVGGANDFLGRYGMKINGETFFSAPLITNGPFTVIFTVYYLDVNATVVRIYYWNGAFKTQAWQVQTGNSGVFKYDQFTITDFHGGGHLPNLNDFSMQQIGPNAIIFGMIKMQIVPPS